MMKDNLLIQNVQNYDLVGEFGRKTLSIGAAIRQYIAKGGKRRTSQHTSEKTLLKRFPTKLSVHRDVMAS